MTFFVIPPLDDDLLAECDVDTFRSSGHGGQNVNKRETAVRLHHRPSGIVVSIQTERHQWRNKQLALEVLRKRLEQRNHRQRPRIATKKPRAVKEKILQYKKKISQKKQLRRKNPFEE